jgi:hypothetical protein
MVYVLIASVAAGAVIGGFRSFADARATGKAADPPATISAVAEAPAPLEAEAAPSGEAIEGEVLEVTNVPNYSYYRVGRKGEEGTWVAVPSATLKVGDHARVVNAMKMTGFKSTTLGKTFAVIYFGTLEGGAAPHGAIPATPAGKNPHAGFADDDAASADPHGRPHDPHAQASQGGVEVKPVDRAPGPSGKTVAEVIGQRGALAGKTVRIRATVVKSTPGVLGRTYLHLRDGSGDQSAGTNDLAATTQATPAVGDTVVLEGVVAIDRDVGAGYRFPTIVEDCKIITP